MKIIRYGILFAFTAIVGAIAVCHPAWLSQNKFLNGFASWEVISVLVVILTITFASVANIHLSLNRIARRVKPQNRAAVEDIRSDINSNAWIIFWAFIVSIAALIAKGWYADETQVVAFIHSIILVVLLLNMLVMHTIYRSVFALVGAENLIDGSDGKGQGEKPSSEGEQDFTSDSPPTGTT